MAGFEQTASANSHLSPPSRQVHSTIRSLPNGPCTYRDLVNGGTCGCNQFWDISSADVHAGSSEKRASNHRSTSCVCTHHACFHQRHATVATPELHALLGCDGRCELQPGSQCSAHRKASAVVDVCPPLVGSPDMRSGRLKTSHAISSQGLLQQAPPLHNGPSQSDVNRETPSDPSASGLPRVPSVCFLSHDRQPVDHNEARQVRGSETQSQQDVTGLGLSLINLEHVGSPAARRPSISSTIPDEIIQPRGSYSESELPSTRANSVSGVHAIETDHAADALTHVLEFNHNLKLDVSGDTIPSTYNPDEFIQSATEVATPSNANTPDLAVADQAVQDAKHLVETISRLTSNGGLEHTIDARPRSAASMRVPQLLLSNSPGIPQEQIRQAIRSASPHALQKLVSYLHPLHNLLNSIPNVATAIREINNRVEMLEGHSFNHVQPEDLQQHFETYEGRLLELEHRMDDHDKLHQAIDADHSSNSLNRRRVATITESFGSNHSIHSTTSSALIVAAIDRKDIDEKLEGINDRLDVLEASALPTTMNPWEVEIVLLPWGRELRGIWYPANDPMHDSTKPTTQDSEDWTQVRNLRTVGQSVYASSPASHENSFIRANGSLSNSEAESGWSSQAISDWVSHSDNDLLLPKACGSKNLVYKRLRSRGFVRNVTLTSTNSREIQATLTNAFHKTTEYLKEGSSDNEPLAATYLGLRALFIPLRKVLTESRLRFLTPSEMVSPAIWSAQFLASGVMMRVSGGKRRLYVTQAQAYLQHSGPDEDPWTWQKLRLLPRFQADPDSQMEGNEEQCQPRVAEADAKEACWAFVDFYDRPPVSVHSSFNSSHSIEMSMRPADKQWRRSITPSSILKNRITQPISPLSEIPRRPSHNRNRTTSASVLEPLDQTSIKRRFNSSPEKHSSAPHISSRAPSVTALQPKRRRVAHSSSPRPEEPAAAVTIWNNTPRRSREPPSPVYSLHPQLPRSNSDVASRSQRSVAVVGKATPFAYATPHSGPLMPEVGFGHFDYQAGDTEPDEDGYPEHDDDEKSWRGVDEGANSNSGDSDAEAGAEREDQGSFSGEDSGFSSEDENDDNADDVSDYGFGAQRRHSNDDEDGDEVFDTLLGVLQH